MASPKLSTPDIIKYGSLQYQQWKWDLSTGGQYEYEQGFFVLSKYYFECYHGNSEELGKKSWAIPLRYVKVVENVDERLLEGKENVFQVMSEKGDDFFLYYMVAQNSTERQDWVDAVRKESIKQNARFLEKYHKGVWTESQGKFNCCDQVGRKAEGCTISSHDQQGFVEQLTSAMPKQPSVPPAPTVSSAGACASAQFQNVKAELSVCLTGDRQTDVSQVVARCVCQDNMATPDVWWNTVLPTRPSSSPCLQEDVFERLVARFCGPATTIEVATAGTPRKVIRTTGESVGETGLRFSSLTLTPEQVNLLDPQNEPQYMYLHGPPGCGKTVVLVLKGLQWLNEGRSVCVISTQTEGRAVSTLLRQQLLHSAGASAAATPKVLQRHYDFYYNTNDVTQAVSDLEAMVRLHNKLAVIMDEACDVFGSLNPKETLKDFMTKIINTKIDVSLWAAGIPNVSRLPPQVSVKTLQSPLRCPPAVTREVEKSFSIRNKDVLPYSAPAQPLPTEGPKVEWLYHSNQPGHSEGDSLNCFSCADRIADILKDLGVNKSATSLQYRDVFILSTVPGFSTGSNNDTVEHLRTYHGIPVRVVNYPPSESDVQEMALSARNELIVAYSDVVSGLERRVVIVLGTGIGYYERLHAMSRSTGCVYYIDPDI